MFPARLERINKCRGMKITVCIQLEPVTGQQKGRKAGLSFSEKGHRGQIGEKDRERWKTRTNQMLMT